jgi:hypothetical protein
MLSMEPHQVAPPVPSDPSGRAKRSHDGPMDYQTRAKRTRAAEHQDGYESGELEESDSDMAAQDTEPEVDPNTK